jgi:hypothetical protein
MRRIYLPALSIIVAGCASSSVPAASSERSTLGVETAAITGGAIDLQITRDPATASDTLAAAPEEVWRALPAVFADMELPLSEAVPAAKFLTATGHRLRRLGGRSMAQYFECPGGYENLAATSEVYLTVKAQVLPGANADESVLRTQVHASARSRNSGNQVICNSRGALEKLILVTLAEKVVAGD